MIFWNTTWYICIPPIDLVVAIPTCKEAEKYSLYSGMPYSLLEICAFHIMQERGNGYWGQCTVSDRVSLLKCKSSHVTLLKMVERFHSLRPETQALQCPTGLICLVPVMSLTLISTFACLRCYSHTGPCWFSNKPSTFLSKYFFWALAPLPQACAHLSPQFLRSCSNIPSAGTTLLEKSIPLLSDFSLPCLTFVFCFYPHLSHHLI